MLYSVYNVSPWGEDQYAFIEASSVDEAEAIALRSFDWEGYYGPPSVRPANEYLVRFDGDLSDPRWEEWVREHSPERAVALLGDRRASVVATRPVR